MLRYGGHGRHPGILGQVTSYPEANLKCWRAVRATLGVRVFSSSALEIVQGDKRECAVVTVSLGSGWESCQHPEFEAPGLQNEPVCAQRVTSREQPSGWADAPSEQLKGFLRLHRLERCHRPGPPPRSHGPSHLDRRRTLGVDFTVSLSFLTEQGVALSLLPPSQSPLLFSNQAILAAPEKPGRGMKGSGPSSGPRSASFQACGLFWERRRVSAFPPPRP